MDVCVLPVLCVVR